MVGSCRLD